MKKNLFILLMCLSLMACEKSLVKEEFDNTPNGVYDAFWTEFDRFYGAFEAKGINWDSLKLIHEKDINASTSKSQLFKALSNLLASLNDGHADINAAQNGYFRSWNRRSKSFFSDSVIYEVGPINQLFSNVTARYLHGIFKKDESTGTSFLYGIIQHQSYKIGYLLMPTFSGGKFPRDFLKEAAVALNSADAVIIDIRFNGGGDDSNSMYAVNLFATERKLIFKSKFRNGPKHSDFTQVYEQYTKPAAEGCKNKPLAILANSFTGSASEHFILGLRSQQNVIQVGDTTCGAFSQVHERVLPNGWMFRLGSQVILTSEGSLLTDSKGRYLEGIGFAPDYYVRDEYKKIREGLDLPLNKAIFELEKLVQQK
jgi:hypothetical protein